MPLDFSTVTIASALVSLDEMKTFLRITGTANDTDVTAITTAAQEAILAYLTTAADATWTDVTAPWRVRHAIKLLTADYYQHRGDDAAGTSGDADTWQTIDRLLGMHRDPTLA